MSRMHEFPFILSLFCIILLHPKCIARNPLDSSSPLNSAPTESHSEPPSSDSPSPSARTFVGSIAEMLIKATAPMHILNPATSPVSYPEPNPSPALKSICDSTDYPEICVSSISPVVPSIGGVDPLSALEASIKVCMEPLNHAAGNLSAASNTTASEDEDSSATAALADCEDNYKDALENLENALEAMQTHDIGTINSLLSAVVSDISTCDDAFQGMDSPVADFDGVIRQMASNCLAIASLIHY